MRAVFATDVENRLASGLRVRAPMHMTAGLRDLRLELLEVEVEVIERMILDRLAGVAQRLEALQALDRQLALDRETQIEAAQRRLQVGVVERLMDVIREDRAVDCMFSRRRSAIVSGRARYLLAEPIGGASAVRPASTSATWRTARGRPAYANGRRC